MTGFFDSNQQEEIDWKKWHCFDPKCSWYKTRMTIEDHLGHLVKIHHMQAPIGYELPVKSSGVNKKNKNKKHKRK